MLNFFLISIYFLISGCHKTDVSHFFLNITDPSLKWNSTGPMKVVSHNDYLEFKCLTTCFLTTSIANVRELSTANTPFVEIKMISNMDLKWIKILLPSLKNKKIYQSVEGIVTPNSAYFDLGYFRPWKVVRSIQPRMSSIGLSFSGTLKLKGIAIDSRPSAKMMLNLIFYELGQPEPIVKYSINSLRGMFILGFRQVYIIAIFFIFCSLIMILVFRKKAYKAIIIFFLISVVINDLPFEIASINVLKDAFKYSAFQATQKSEYSSRFGDNFYNLHEKILSQVPRGSRVYFTLSSYLYKYYDTNFLEYLYKGKFKASSVQDADYIFVYHPLLDYFSSKTTFSANSLEWKIENLYSPNPSEALLRVIK